MSSHSPFGLPSMAVREADFMTSAFKTLSTARRGPNTGRTPWGGASTAAGGTAQLSAYDVECVVVSIIDNRAGEIGLAAMDLNRGTMELMQYGDDASQSKTLMQLTVLHPVEILLPHTCLQSRLALTIARHFAHTANITAVHRREYNESRGAHRLMQLMSAPLPLGPLASDHVTQPLSPSQQHTTTYLPRASHGSHVTSSSASSEILHTDHYLCIAASHALLSFVESTNGVIWMAGTVSVRYKVLDGLVQLDRGTAKGLKVISSVAPLHGHARREVVVANTSSAPNRGQPPPHASGAASLAEALDFTQTLGGRRLLRRNVLQPLRDIPAIRLRQDAVAFLLSRRTAFVAFRNQLRRISCPLDLDTVVSAFASVPSSPVTRASTAYVQRCVSNLVSLRQVIVVVQSIVEELRSVTALSEGSSGKEIPEQQYAVHDADEESATSRKWKRSRDEDDDHIQSRDVPVPRLLQSIFATLEASSLGPLRERLDAQLDEDIISGRALTTGGACTDAGGESDAAQHHGPPLSARRTTYQRPQGVAMQVQQCFAIRPTISSALDVARESYASLMEAVFQHVEALKDTHRVSSLKLKFDTQRHLFLVYDAQHDGLATPQVFLRKHRPPKSRSMTCTTHELTSLKASITEVLDEIANAQREVVERLTAHVRDAMPTLQAVCDAIALLDMMVSFASFSVMHSGTCPELVTYGPVVSNGCQLVHLVKPGGTIKPATPTAVDIQVDAPVVILGGPNASGKSTLLRVVGHASIIAHIGCFIPVAAHSLRLTEPRPVFRLLDRVVALVPERDDASGASNGTMESSFFHEMRSVAFATQVITRSSLVLVDEVGRGTSTMEGTCVARSLVEWLADVRCIAIVATHLMGLVKIPQMIQRVQNQHMAVDVVASHHPQDKSCRPPPGIKKTSAVTTLSFPYVPIPGPCATNHYGIRLAEHLGVAPHLLCHVPRVLRILDVGVPDAGSGGVDGSTKPLSASSVVERLLDAIENHPAFMTRRVRIVERVADLRIAVASAALTRDASSAERVVRCLHAIVNDLHIRMESVSTNTLPTHAEQPPLTTSYVQRARITHASASHEMQQRVTPYHLPALRSTASPIFSTPSHSPLNCN